MKRSIIKRMTIRQLLVVGIGGIMAAFVLLSTGWISSVTQLIEMKERLYTDARSLHTDHLLELAVIGANREALLWRSTGDPRYREEALAHRSESDRLLKELRGHLTDSAEVRIIEAIESQHRVWRNLLPAASSQRERDNSALDDATDALVAIVHRHRELNARNMEQTAQAGLRMESQVRREMQLLLPLALLTLVLGGIEMWKRIVRPTLRLAQAAEAFGAGDLEARAEATRHDEINTLCRTFNVMADAICDREKDRLRFVATVAHDLKNPLMVIGGATDMMRLKLLSPQQQDEWLERISRNVRSLEGIVADLLDGVQIQTGYLQLHCGELNLAELTANVMRDYKASLLQKTNGDTPSHSLLFEGDETCTIWGDRQRLERVLVNLLSNAVKYSPAGSEVRLTLWQWGGSVRITVEDQGEGIAPEDVKRLLQPFTRLEGTRHKTRGTGLGLVSAQKIIEAHGGKLNIFSRPGQGTIVEILLRGINGDEASHNSSGNHVNGYLNGAANGDAQRDRALIEHAAPGSSAGRR